ncbi:hypothetical protein J7K27_11075, partial [Candidatus Bathyarchaeota archaeon]|nr:hypothetical protein [Candidatus Bathyarchaeota archaeon]
MKNSLVYGLVSVLIIIVLLTFFSSINVTAESLAVVWSDRKDYFPDETARIFGYGFIPFSQVTLIWLKGM